MLRLALALAAAPLILAPAQAADLKTIDCVQTSVTAAARSQFVADVEANFNDLDNQKYSQATVEGMRAAGKACQAKYGWSEKATQASILYALFGLGEQVMRRRAAQAGLDVTKLEQRFMALSEIERADAMAEGILDKLAQGALDANEMNADNAKVAGGVFGYFAIRSKSVIDFVAN